MTKLDFPGLGFLAMTVIYRFLGLEYFRVWFCFVLRCVYTDSLLQYAFVPCLCVVLCIVFDTVLYIF